VLPDVLGERASGRVVAAHLGSGASMCAMRDRKSVTSTMGFSTLDGLMMGTRCGSIDPGVLLYLLQEGIVDVDGLADMLYRRSGLLGVSGISADMRTLLASREASAAEAVALFCHVAIEQLGAMAAVLGGLDALVFTGGIGEHSPAIRKALCEAAGWLGVSLDQEKNEANLSCISTPDSRIPVHVIPADEETMIARHTTRVLM
jgi:acetate kinase